MGLEITPNWDPTGAVRLRLDPERGELAVSGKVAVLRFRLCDESPERLGWHEQPRDGKQARRVPVSEVLCHCLGEDEAERAVLELSRRAARRAIGDGGCWRAAGRRLRDQCASGRSTRLSVVPFQSWWTYLSDPARAARLDESTAALRAGFRMEDGRPDTTRLLRRLGIAERQDRGGRRARGRTVNHATGIALCRALDRDPVELGL